MRIRFFIRFYTYPGQHISIEGNFSGSEEQKEERLSCRFFNSEYWTCDLELDRARIARISYKYVLVNQDGSEVAEGGIARQIDLSKTGVEEIQVIDLWNHAGDTNNVFYSAPFQEIYLKDQGKSKGRSQRNFTHIFRVKMPLLDADEQICIVGTGTSLGEWDPKTPQLLTREKEWWTIKLQMPPEGIPVHYKYAVYHTRKKEIIEYEQGENRVLMGAREAQTLTILHDGFARLRQRQWKGAGVAIPVFSLRSKNSFGIGEFNDLKLLADWAKLTGLKLIQILPVNDTTATHSWKDSYPYSAISAFALHPAYINLEQVAGKKYASLIRPLKKKQKQLNEQKFVDYDTVMKFKFSVLRELFTLQQEQFLNDEDFSEFFEGNRHWLAPYAAFCYLRDRNETADFSKWKIYSAYDQAAIEKYVSPKAKHYDQIAFHYFVQYHLHLQLQAAVQYAHKLGVALKGDIPIGIYRDGADAWMNPALFHMDMQAGAPPDAFAIKGQNWGFPTYNWERMAQDGFDWWKKRFEQMSLYFDAFRIDHILGFFRIWSIPTHAAEGIMGYFVPSIPVHLHEFNQRNMWFNFHRLCMPYISDSVLWEMFGPNAGKFSEFLIPTGNGHYELKEDFNEQIKVRNYFEEKEEDEDHRHLQQGLFDLISNRIFFEKPGSGGQEFYFRFDMENTISFRHLDAHMQQQLKYLYLDYFFVRQDEFWKEEAMRKLPPLKYATNMLICGEDLGMVPDCVPDVMQQLGLLSLEIQRMPKDSKLEFFHPDDAPYLSVVSPSTHDMSTVRGWWKEDPELTQRFYNYHLGQEGKAPEDCPGWVAKIILRQHIYSPAIFSIFQLQDLLAIDEDLRYDDIDAERINVPADPNHYWRYRMHLYLEELIKAKSFNSTLREELQRSHRV